LNFEYLALACSRALQAASINDASEVAIGAATHSENRDIMPVILAEAVIAYQTSSTQAPNSWLLLLRQALLIHLDFCRQPLNQ
jgi:hypothetical protein